MSVGRNKQPPIDIHPDKGPWISELKPGEGFIGFYVARNPRLDPFRDPSKGNYMRLLLSDRTGWVQARIWEDADLAAEEIADCKPIKVDAVADFYNDELQVQIRRFRLAKDGEVKREDFVNSSQRDLEQIWLSVRNAISAVQDPFLNSLLRFFFVDISIARRFLEIPASRVVHHAYMSGLLEHCYELLKLAEPLVDLYPELDRDLLTTGLLLHDIGKLQGYDYDYDISVTDAGKLIGHVVLSASMISRAIESIEGFPKNLAHEVLHLIVSHHGRYEWGAARRPKSLEAVALHHLDNLDAQVNRFNLLIQKARENGKTWTDYDRMLGRMLYAGEPDRYSLDQNYLTE